MGTRAIPTLTIETHAELYERVQFAVGRSDEARDAEFKRAMPWPDLRIHIVKTAIAMANLPGGGIIVVGVEQDSGWRFAGIQQTNVGTFDPDIVSDAVNSYASSRIQIGLWRFEYKPGTDLLVIVAEPCLEVPVLCSKNGPDNSGFRAGDILIRPIGKPETRRPMSAGEMMELLSQHIERKASELVRQLQRIGTPPDSRPDDEYAKELDGL